MTPRPAPPDLLHIAACLCVQMYIVSKGLFTLAIFLHIFVRLCFCYKKYSNWVQEPFCHKKNSQQARKFDSVNCQVDKDTAV